MPPPNDRPCCRNWARSRTALLWPHPTPARPLLRQAASDDRTLLIDWVRAFNAETEGDTSDPEPLVDRWLVAGQLWLWDNGKPMSMAVARQPVGGVSRLSGVYTPPENRGLGYAAACVYGLSKSLREAGYRCVLYTDLGNPTSNSIYRRLG